MKIISNKRSVRGISILISVLLMVMTAFTSFAAGGTGKTEDTLEKDIRDAMQGLETIFEDEYAQAEADIKKKVQEKNWDYEYTMDSFYNEGNPFTTVDYGKLIAAYATIIEYGRNGRGILSTVPFLSTTISEKKSPDGTGCYGSVKFKVMSPEDLFKYYGYNISGTTVGTRYQDCLSKITDALETVKLQETIFISTPEKVVSDETDYTKFVQKIPKGLKDSEPERYRIVTTALSLIGQVPYDWGGKPVKAGYDTSWWTYDSARGRQKGLDCSGFVQWVFMTLHYPTSVTDKLYWTGAIRDNLEAIEEDELRPGDIGLKNETESDINHTGIYLGNGLWVHCSSAGHTVVCNGGSFRYYRRAPLTGGEGTGIYGTDDSDTTTTSMITSEADDSDVLTLAQLIEHEAGGESFNGWVAVGEVVMNRVRSTGFPNTIHDVIYQKHQFENVQEIADISPRPEMISCARLIIEGRLRIFNDEQVLFFKNPMTTDGVPAATPYDWGRLKWYTSIGHHAFYVP